MNLFFHDPYTYLIMQERPPSVELLGGILGAISKRIGADCGTVHGANALIAYVASYSRTLLACLEALTLDDLLEVYEIAERLYRPHAEIIRQINGGY